jgi:hypothetical protein
MKRLALVLGILVPATGNAQAGTVTTNTAAPTVDGADIALLDLTGSAGQGKFWAGEGFAAGQTFTTGSDSGGYLLHAATIRYHGTYDPGSQTTEFDPAKTYGVRVVTLSGTTITALHDEVFVHSVAARAGDYLTFALSTPVALSPDTVYGFDVRMTASTSGWQTGIPTVTYRSNSYAGGEYYTCSQWTDGNKGNWSATDLALAIPNAGRDWVFHLDIESSRSPGTMILLR